jgi:hypothetical protein
MGDDSPGEDVVTVVVVVVVPAVSGVELGLATCANPEFSSMERAAAEAK